MDPPHVLCGRSPPPKVANIKIHDSLSVAFRHPYAPTPPQMQVMTTLADALYDGAHCIVEAPTGTGKTAAVLTPLLAFQAQQFDRFGVTDPGAVPRIIYVARTLPQLDNTGAELASYPYAALVAAPVAKEHLCMLPRVEGTSRADQCRAACRKLSAEEQEQMPGRKTHCAFLDKQNELDLPASRIDDYFTGGELAATSIEQMVERSRTAGVCAFHVSRDLAQTNGASVLMLTYNQLFDPHLRACNKTDALLKGALLFVDEAHNVPGVCRDAASESLSMAQLITLRNEAEAQRESLRDLLKSIQSPHFFRQDENMTPRIVEGAIKTVDKMIQLSCRLNYWLHKETAPDSVRRTWENDDLVQTTQLPGEYAQDLIVRVLIESGVLPSAAVPGSPAAAGAPPAAGVGSPAPSPAATSVPPSPPPLPPPPSPPPAASPAMLARAMRRSQAVAARNAMEDLADDLNAVDAALKEAGHRSSTATTSHRTPTGRFGVLLSKLSTCVGANAACYALVLRRLSPAGVKAEQAKPSQAARSPLPQLDIVCLTASVAMARVLELARCAVYGTGTLGPAADFACEIGLLDGGYRAVSTEHHASVQTQLLPLVFKGSPRCPMLFTSVNIKASLKAGGEGVIDDARDVLLSCAPSIPGGILVFFGSKGVCRKITSHWIRDGTMYKLSLLLPHANALVIDDAEEADVSLAHIERYLHFASRPSAHGRPTAIMFAALRGRASEGTDFKDGLARGVFVLSVPLPPCKDPFVVAKKAFNDRMGRPLPEGKKWYNSEGVRCAAQAVGRVIRHAGDHGVAVLLDCRYATGRPGNDSVFPLLPTYLKGLLQTHNNIAELAAKLPPFFARCAALPAPPAGGVKTE